MPNSEAIQAPVPIRKNPVVWGLGLVSFFADIASEMLYPVTPIFLTHVLGASILSVGIIEGCADAVANILKYFSGYWVDRLQNHRFFVVLGYLFSALAKPLTGLASGWIMVLIARSLDRVGKGLRTVPRDTWLAGSVPAAQRGEAFGWHRGMDSLGAALGPIVALVYLTKWTETPENLRHLYFWALVPGLLAVAWLFRVPKLAAKVADGPPAVSRGAAHVENSDETKMNNDIATDAVVSGHNRNLYFFIGIWTLFSIGNSTDSFLLLQVSAKNHSLTSTILLYCGFNLVYALMSPKLGKLSDRVGRPVVLFSGLLLFAAVYFGFGFASLIWHFAVLFLSYGIFMAATDGVAKAYLTDLVPPNRRGRGFGLLSLCTGMATIFASVFGGWLWDHYGASTMFIFASVCSLLAASALLLLQWHRKPTYFASSMR